MASNRQILSRGALALKAFLLPYTESLILTDSELTKNILQLEKYVRDRYQKELADLLGPSLDSLKELWEGSTKRKELLQTLLDLMKANAVDVKEIDKKINAIIASDASFYIPSRRVKKVKEEMQQRGFLPEKDAGGISKHLLDEDDIDEVLADFRNAPMHDEKSVYFVKNMINPFHRPADLENQFVEAAALIPPKEKVTLLYPLHNNGGHYVFLKVVFDKENINVNVKDSLATPTVDKLSQHSTQKVHDEVMRIIQKVATARHLMQEVHSDGVVFTGEQLDSVTCSYRVIKEIVDTMPSSPSSLAAIKTASNLGDIKLAVVRNLVGKGVPIALDSNEMAYRQDLSSAKFAELKAYQQAVATQAAFQASLSPKPLPSPSPLIIKEEKVVSAAMALLQLYKNMWKQCSSNFILRSAMIEKIKNDMQHIAGLSLNNAEIQKDISDLAAVVEQKKILVFGTQRMQFFKVPENKTAEGMASEGLSQWMPPIAKETLPDSYFLKDNQFAGEKRVRLSALALSDSKKVGLGDVKWAEYSEPKNDNLVLRVNKLPEDLSKLSVESIFNASRKISLGAGVTIKIAKFSRDEVENLFADSLELRENILEQILKNKMKRSDGAVLSTAEIESAATNLCKLYRDKIAECSDAVNLMAKTMVENFQNNPDRHPDRTLCLKKAWSPEIVKAIARHCRERDIAFANKTGYFANIDLTKIPNVELGVSKSDVYQKLDQQTEAHRTILQIPRLR